MPRKPAKIVDEFAPLVILPAPMSQTLELSLVLETKPIEPFNVDVQFAWLLNAVSIYALNPSGVTPVLAKVQPELNVPVKLELFKFCAHAASLAAVEPVPPPTIG